MNKRKRKESNVFILPHCHFGKCFCSFFGAHFRLAKRVRVSVENDEPFSIKMYIQLCKQFYCLLYVEDPAAHDHTGHWCAFTDLYHTMARPTISRMFKRDLATKGEILELGFAGCGKISKGAGNAPLSQRRKLSQKLSPCNLGKYFSAMNRHHEVAHP